MQFLKILGPPKKIHLTLYTTKKGNRMSIHWQFSGVPCIFHYSFKTYLSLYKVTILFPGIFIMWREFFPGKIIFTQQSSCFKWYVCSFVHSFFKIVMCPFFSFISLRLRSIANQQQTYTKFGQVSWLWRISLGIWVNQKRMNILDEQWHIFFVYGLFPSCTNPLFQREAKWEAIDMKMILYFHANKTHYNKKGFTLSLVLKLGEFCRTREWPISSCARTVM